MLLVAVACGVVSMGVVSAWLVTAYRFPGRGLLEWALLLPLAMPAYVMAYAYTDWLQFSGPVQSALRGLTGWQAREYWFPEVRSLAGAAAMLSFALYPYVYLIARTAFQDLSRSAIEAGRLAGYGAGGAFMRVAVPLARPAIVAGATLALMETLADFGTVSYFGVEVFTTGIFKTWFSLGDSIAAAQLSACLLGFVVVLLALERANRGRAAYYGMAPRKARAHRLRGGRAAIAFAACAAPVFFGFALPALLLGGLAFDERIAAAPPDFAGGEQLRRGRGHRADRRCHCAGDGIRGTPYAQPAGSRGEPPRGPGICRPGRGDCGRRAGAARPPGQRACGLARAGVRRALRPSAHRDHRGAGVRLPGAATGGGAADHGGRPGEDHAEHGGRGALAGRDARPGTRARACAAARAEPGDRVASGLRRCPEGAAGHHRAAAIQLRHPGDRGLQPGEGRAAGRSRPSFARDRCGRACCR